MAEIFLEANANFGRALSYDHPELAPVTIPKGPDGQRKQSVINWSTWLRSAIPSLTTRFASRTMAKYTRLVT